MSQIRWVGYLLAAIVAAALVTAIAWKPAPPPRFQGLAKVPIPMVVGDYRGAVAPVDAQTRTALGSAQVTAREYTAPNGMRIELTMIGGTDRSALHDPRSCLIGDGWQITDDHVEKLPGSAVPVRVCHAEPANSQASYDVEYLYVSGGRVISSATQIRFALLEAALLEQNDAPVYYIRLITPLPLSPAAQAVEHARLQRFASGFWQKMAPALGADGAPRIKGESS